MSVDEFDLDRFIDAQRDHDSYATALAELRTGRKRSHWIWYIFPQLKGLGSSWAADHYGISGLAEARAYAAHPVLGPRLSECIAAVLAHRGTSASDILGSLDALKFRSCLTLFFIAAPQEPVFAEALEVFFAGGPDVRTMEILEARGEA